MRRYLADAAIGAIAGCAAMLVFLWVHAITIVPIWTSAGTGIAWSIPIGATMSVATRIVLGRRPRLREGAFAGAIAWLGIAINTGVALLIRALWPRVPEVVEIVEAIVVALAFGATVAWRFRHRVAGAIGSLATLLVVGGPVTQALEMRGALILIGLLPVMVTFGFAQACLAQYVKTQGEDNAQCNHDVEVGPRNGEEAAARAQ